MDALQTPQKYLKNPKPVPPFLFPVGTAIPLSAMLEILKSTLFPLSSSSFPLLPHPFPSGHGIPFELQALSLQS